MSRQTTYQTSIDIQADPELIFKHLTTPEGMVAWMGERAELTPEPGGLFAVDINGDAMRGRYLEVVAPQRVVVSWGTEGSAEHPPGSSKVEFTLVGVEGGTHLTLIHSGLAEAKVEMHGKGWQYFLGRLTQATAGIQLRPETWRDQV
jgi:uncharacterized protein YndB with AHSA1/START domain